MFTNMRGSLDTRNKGKFAMESVFITRRRAGGEKADVIYEGNYGSFIMVLLRFAVLLIACFFFVISFTSSSVVQGIPANTKYRSSRDYHSRQGRSPNDLDKLFPFPTIKVRGRLQSRTGFFLEILQNGTIQATMNNSSIYTKLEMQSYNRTFKRFRGIVSKYFLACEIRGKRRGRFSGILNLTTDSLFVEHMEENEYLTYRTIRALNFPNSFNNTGYLAIKSNGKFRRVERAEPGMYASQFQFIRLDN